ncbi:MAG: class I SAM-dependent methyltransferase [Actinomycetes bacterium]
MKLLTLVFLLAIGLGLAYCIRSLRALHRKVNTRIAREISASTKELKAEVWQSFRQSEAMQQLLSLLKFSAPVPPTRSWAASPDLLLTLTQLVRTHNPKLVVELGSGVSTLVVAKAGAKKVISIDNSAEFAGKTREVLKEHKVRGVDIRVAELKAHISGVDWYDTNIIKDLKRIDLLIVDGPPGSKNPQARMPARAEFIAKLSPKAIIVIDDVNRDGERKLAEAFAKALPNHILTIYPHEKGTAVISPK